MDEQQREILSRLAQGVDPATGEVFPADSPYQRAEVIRALYAAVNPDGQAQRSARSGAQAPRAGKPWTKEEEARMLARFEAGEDAGQIARHLERSKVAITARLVKLGKIDPPPDLVLRQPARPSA